MVGRAGELPQAIYVPRCTHARKAISEEDELDEPVAVLGIPLAGHQATALAAPATATAK